MEAQLAEAPRAALAALDPLEGFSVALGTDLVTVRLGPLRNDAFDRLRLAEVMPAIRPEFGAGFAAASPTRRPDGSATTCSAPPRPSS